MEEKNEYFNSIEMQDRELQALYNRFEAKSTLDVEQVFALEKDFIDKRDFYASRIDEINPQKELVEVVSHISDRINQLEILAETRFRDIEDQDGLIR